MNSNFNDWEKILPSYVYWIFFSFSFVLQYLTIFKPAGFCNQTDMNLLHFFPPAEMKQGLLDLNEACGKHFFKDKCCFTTARQK